MSLIDDARGEAAADAAGLIYVHDDGPGIRRVASGQKADYVDAKGRQVRDERTLERIRKLVIPPAYTDVWICPSPRGHIQATGRDAKGRKQYRYHPDWRGVRDQGKYARMAQFGRALPAIRSRVEADLRRHGLPKDKVLATVVRLLELTLIRVGNSEYSRTNKSFGLTTLRDRHVTFGAGGLKFTFKGKSGVNHTTGLRDRRLARIVKTCQDIPGQRLFQYLGEDGEHRAIESTDVNAYLRGISGYDFTAKDFRTWAGTLSAAKALAMQPAPASEAEAKRLVSTCVKATAGLLGNTPAVCRSAYIHPEIFTAFGDGRLPKAFANCDGSECEAALLKLLDALAKANAKVERKKAA